MTAIKYTEVSGPSFADAEHTRINCLVMFPSLSRDAMPFTAAEVDPGAEHSEEIFARCLAGEFGPVAPFEEVQPVRRAETSATVKAILDRPDVRAFRARKPEPPPAVKKRKPPAPAKPPKRKR
jgi:hypothetical protein